MALKRWLAGAVFTLNEALWERHLAGRSHRAWTQKYPLELAYQQFGGKIGIVNVAAVVKVSLCRLCP